MAQQVVNGAMLTCSFGVAPSSIVVTPENLVNAGGQPAATAMDHVPFKNIMPFGMCTAPTNPAVLAAQGAPVPCTPVTAAPWVPGCLTVMLSKKPALNSSSTLMCSFAGVITVQMPGQFTVNIP
jgi:hypothetical protein